jgi:hypothetical protein
MRRTFWIPLFAARLAATGAWAASVLRNLSLKITGATETVSLNPTNLTFASQIPGTLSAAQSVTMTNTGTAPFPVSGVGIAGSYASHFAEANNCSTSFAVGINCQLYVTFAFTAVGTRAASLVVSATGSGTYTAQLSGTSTSVNGTTIPSATAIGDGSPNPVTADVNLLLYYNGTIYQQTSSGEWYQLNTTSWPAGGTGSTYLSGGDPRTASCTGVSVTPTTAIQNAINANPAGTTFCLAAGTWSNPVFTPKSNDHFIGAGAGKTILDGTGTAGQMTDGWDAGVTGVVIDGVTVTGYQANNIGTAACASGGGLPQVTTGNGWIIRNSTFQNSGCIGVFIDGSATLRNNRFTNHQKSVNIPGAGTAILVQGNEIDNNNQGHYAQNNTPAGIKCYAGPGWPSIQTVSILNNYVHDNVATGIWLDTNIKNATVQGNTIINNAVYGVHYEASPGPCGISHNVINGNGTGPFYSQEFPGMSIYISTSSNCNVHDNNVFSPTGSWALSICKPIRAAMPPRALDSTFISITTL